jgi:glycosyltransferase involved in cell wall biosynthesis
MKKKPISVGIVILAYNEEKNIKYAIEAALREVPKVTPNYEIVIVNDGSRDKTGQLADGYTKKFRQIKVIHHSMNRGFARTFLDGVSEINKEFVVSYPGDYDTSEKSLAQIITRAKKDTIVISYPDNPETRPLARRIISSAVVKALNLIFGMKLRYYTGSFICETEKLKNINFISRGFAVYAEAKIRLIRQGLAVEEMPFLHIGRRYGKTSAISLKSLLETLETVCKLRWEMYNNSLAKAKE